jgi:adenine-specific DNA-methyltransferase
MMRDRLSLLWRLLSDDGSIWITIDDNEAHYLKVLCDELFGRRNFIADIAWQKRYSPDARVALSDAHEHLLCYAKNPKSFSQTRNLLPLTEAQTKQFKNPDKDPRGPWKANDFTAAGYRPNQMYPIKLPSGRKVTPPEGRCWRVTKAGFETFKRDGMMYYGTDGDSVPALKRYLSEMEGMVPWTWWPHTEVGHSQEAKKESQDLFGRDAAFSTPKPERLVERIIHISTNRGDLVLDSFAGSGTTGAVAHKMGRRWIMIELGDHAKTHIVPRLRKVIDGNDTGGVTESSDWKGGGGFRFCTLSPSLLEKDRWGNWTVSKKYTADMLAESICKHFNYKYAPSPNHYWMHGASSETSFIYVTTSSLTFEQLRAISDEVGDSRSLLICCTAYEMAGESLPNLTLRKIPAAVLDRCEWSRDDYSLKINATQGIPQDEDAGASATDENNDNEDISSVGAGS